jgi:hypothetical protein
MSKRGYIPDGYTYKGFIAAVPGLFDDFRFEYRPMTTLERSRLLTENAKLKTDRVIENTCKAVASKIKSWDLEDPTNGESVPVGWEVLSKNIEPALYERIFGIVAGYDASSPDPLKEAREPTSEQELASADDGPLIGDKMLEDQQKN